MLRPQAFDHTAVVPIASEPLIHTKSLYAVSCALLSVKPKSTTRFDTQEVLKIRQVTEQLVTAKCTAALLGGSGEETKICRRRRHRVIHYNC